MLVRHLAFHLLIATCSTCVAAEAIIAKPFTAIYGADGKPMIVGGQPADPADYPASYRSDSGGRACTWFLVGPGVLLGAAHCVAGVAESDPLIEVNFSSQNGSHHATCSISSWYWKDRSQDWALCKVAPIVPKPIGANGISGFEIVSQHGELLDTMPKLEISGFGCIAEGTAPSEVYFIGSARVAQLPPNARVLGSPIATPNVIKMRQAPSLLCGGDSGGPAFFFQKPIGKVLRVVVGTNSSTAIEAGVSYLSSLSTPAAISFFKNWSDANQEKICGIDKDVSGCRNFIPWLKAN